MKPPRASDAKWCSHALCLARSPGTEQDREIWTVCGAVSIEVATREVPVSEQNREISAVDGEVAVEIAKAVIGATEVGRALLAFIEAATVDFTFELGRYITVLTGPL